MHMEFLNLDLKTLITIIGYLGIFLFVFAESGLFFGFFLPGDSLLFTAGLLAAEGYFSLSGLMLLSFVAAVLGDSVGYWFGKRTGPLLFTREDTRFFKKSHVEKSRAYYEKHGPKTIILARFIPIVRTFAPILAGVSGMTYKTFFAYNIVGGLLWTTSMPILGYFLGTRIPHIDAYILPIALGIIVVSFIPIFWKMWKARSAK
jgi:membrane-associated protein